MLALVSMRRLTEIDWRVLEDPEWHLSNHYKRKIVVFSVEQRLICRTANGAEVLEGNHAKV